MPRCIHHPGEPSELELGGAAYCSRCRIEQAHATSLIDPGVFPRGCFVGRSEGRWWPLRVSACVHWLAHSLGVQGPTSARCLAGYAIRLEDLLAGRRLISEEEVRPGDLIAVPGGRCGAVADVERSPARSPRICVQHLEPEVGRVLNDEFHLAFGGLGHFYR
ncbi:MAG: hypothetical protein ACE5IL_06480 [Myxococcota bacterium]